MIDQQIIELINEELDDQLSASQRERLHRHLDTNPEARAYADELKRLKGVLGRVEQVEPPDSLKVGILNSIRATSRPKRSAPGFLPSFLERLSNPAIPRYGLAVASGICLGVFLFAVLTGGFDASAREDHVSGSVGAAVSPARTVTDYGLFEGSSSKSSVQVVTSGMQVFVEAEVMGTESSEISVMFPSEAYTVVGIRRHGGTLHAIHAEGGSVNAAVAGDGRLTVELEQTGERAPDIRLELRQDGRLLWGKALRTTPGD